MLKKRFKTCCPKESSRQHQGRLCSLPVSSVINSYCSQTRQCFSSPKWIRRMRQRRQNCSPDARPSSNAVELAQEIPMAAGAYKIVSQMSISTNLCKAHINPKILRHVGSGCGDLVPLVEKDERNCAVDSGQLSPWCHRPWIEQISNMHTHSIFFLVMVMEIFTWMATSQSSQEKLWKHFLAWKRSNQYTRDKFDNEFLFPLIVIQIPKQIGLHRKEALLMTNIEKWFHNDIKVSSVLHPSLPSLHCLHYPSCPLHLLFVRNYDNSHFLPRGGFDRVKPL